MMNVIHTISDTCGLGIGFSPGNVRSKGIVTDKTRALESFSQQKEDSASPASHIGDLGTKFKSCLYIWHRREVLLDQGMFETTHCVPVQAVPEISIIFGIGNAAAITKCS